MKRLILLILLIIAGIGAFVLHACGDDGAGSPDAQSEAGPSRATTLAARFGPPEGMARGTQAAIRRNLGGGRRLALRYNEAQSLHTPTGVHLWLVEGAAVACLFVAAKPAPASACRTSVQAASEGLSLGTYKTDPDHPGVPTQFLAAGIDPNEVSSLAVTVGGQPERVPVRRGVWAIRAKAPIFSRPQG